MGLKFQVLGRFRDVDGTEKTVYETGEGIVELTHIKNKAGIDVICVPTHHYCNLGCKFCHLTVENDYTKSMTPIKADVLESILRFDTPDSKKVLISFMGVGEPLLNLELILNLYSTLSKYCPELSFAMSTMFPVPFEEVRLDRIPLKIHFSLHSPVDEIRKEIIPASTVNVEEGFQLLRKHQMVTSLDPSISINLGRFHDSSSSVEIHYTLIEKVNDSDVELARLIELGHTYRIPLKLLKFNQTRYLKPSKRGEYWLRMLEMTYGPPVRFYAPPGPNIGSSCGQFTKHYYLGCKDEEEQREFEEWKRKYQVG
jgi:23S rRNA (adenine2503-C2)-methyltransferase